jgi:hypothetical protein
MPRPGSSAPAHHEERHGRSESKQKIKERGSAIHRERGGSIGQAASFADDSAPLRAAHEVAHDCARCDRDTALRDDRLQVETTVV